MTVQDWISSATAQLAEAGISTARLDCLVLLADELERDKSWLLSHPEHELQGSILKILSTKIAQRARHVPLAYIRGHAEFYGREFAVNAHTLVPRPETEAMVELLLQLVASAESEITIADVGTGSGAIAVTAKLELPRARVVATDIDKQCLATAGRNAEALGADIAFMHGNLLQPLRELANRKLILLCNLPYVPDNFQINTAATHEPHHALFGGPDGLDLYRELFLQTAALHVKPVAILAESMPPQHDVLAGIAKAAGYHLAKTESFIQLFLLPTARA